jgi:tetratricopeptide (TPR) repeat protein
MVLETRFERTKVMDDLEEAINVGRQAVAATSSNPLPHITCLNNLARKVYCLYTHTAALSDLEVAADLAKRAVAATPDGHPDRVGCLNHLGNILESWYKTTGSMKHLEEALSIAQQAVVVASGNDSDRIACLINLGNKLVLRYEKSDTIRDLDEAIDMDRQAVAVTCKDHPDYASYLNNLASRLSRRFDRTGEVTDIERAIHAARQLLEAVPQGHPDHAGWLSNLGIMLESRYRQLGIMNDLEEAISVTRQAVANTPANHLFYASYLNNLSNKLERRYKRTGEMNDLQEAIDLARRAIEAVAPDHPDRAMYFDNLGDNLESLYEHTKEMSDLEAAIDASREANVATAMPINHLDHLGRLNNLGNKLASRYDRTGVMEDLEEAIGLARQAVAVIPKDHPDRPGYLNNRGLRLERRHEKTGSPNDLKEACDSFIEAWETPSAIPFHRIRSATHCIRLLVLQGKAKAAAKIGTGAIGLLSLLNTKLLNRTDQQYVVSTFAGIAANTCALLLAMGKVKDALLHLEQGRAVILGQLMDGRSDIAGWATTKPKLARRYEKLRNKINSPIRIQERGMAGDRARQERIQSISDLNDCIIKIRKIPGCERLLRCQTTKQMKECAKGGIIVIANITESRSDAIIVSPTAIKRIHLPDLPAAEATTWLNTSWTGRRAERARKNKEYANYLSWLWNTCVKVVLDGLLALDEPTICEPFRVWWIGSGLASSMPFHAAGIHDPGSTETAYHQTISSYTPSIKALAHAQWKEQGCETSSDALLVVTMPTTPPAGGKAPPGLPGANEEMENVIELSKGYLPGEGMLQPSVDQVLSHLEGCSVAHFACHGTTDPLDPLKSGLILQRQGQVSTVDDEQDGCRETAGLIQDRLTVKMISEMDLKHAKLAYLSACSTAQNKV